MDKFYSLREDIGRLEVSESEVSGRWRETVAGVIYRHEPEADTHYPRGHRIDFTASHANALEALLARALKALEEAIWFVEWVDGASLKPREAGMDVQARKWLPKVRGLRSELREASNK